MNSLDTMNNLVKALEAGSQNAAPSTLVQGPALQIENLEPQMELLTFEDKHIKLQKELKVKDCKSQLVQFNRQLDYGIFGGSAQFEGAVGEENTSQYSRIVVPMAYYSAVRRNTVAAQLVRTFDGVKAEDRVMGDEEKRMAGDIEFDLVQGQAHFSNAGAFDGNPLAVADLPNMVGMDQQIRLSDDQANAQDQMFSEFGSDQSVVLPANGALSQGIIEDAAVRSAMNMGAADKLRLDPIALSAYNKISFAKERIVLAGAAQEASGANLRSQWTSSGAISLEPSRFLSGKTKPARSRAGSPAAPAAPTPSAALAAGALIPAGDYVYYVTAVNQRGESAPSAQATHTVAADGDGVSLAITAVSGAKYYNVYRSNAGGSASDAKFIGRIRQGSGNPAFKDLGNKTPGFVTGYLTQGDTMDIQQLAPYSSMKLAMNDLSVPQVAFRFLSLAVKQPRKNVIIDNLDGQL